MPSCRVTICLYNNLKNTKFILIDKETTTYEQILKSCSQKFQTKILSLTLESGKKFNLDDLKDSSIKLICSPKENISETIEEIKMEKTNVFTKIYANKSYIHLDVHPQLKFVEKLEGVTHVIGMPDLHPGKGCPIGAITITKNIIYPHLIGEDIGCGMSLVKTPIPGDINFKKVERLSKRLELDFSLPQDQIDEYLSSELYWPSKVKVGSVENTLYDHQLGTIGAGNHFAELQIVDKIVDEKLCQEYDITQKFCYLLVHSGSRGLGENILNTYFAQIDNLTKTGIKIDDNMCKKYLKEHDNAKTWAKRNRALIAKKFIESCYEKNIDDPQLVKYECIIDIWHNYLEKKDDNLIHRKGVAPADQGPIVIPGSRGSMSYIVMPINGSIESGWSLSHGAGRKITRTKALSTLKDKIKDYNSLKVTDLDSIVLCSNKDLLYEEAPQNYKDIDEVIQDLVEYNLIKIIAIMKPVLTYKVN
ncbi:MAG: release factor h-coupled family protein [Edafosvirus sp.]|uniref:3'-phosphate/5'-hydroxy nucleic acid ligase n=1 Tax=Edafosvirus sp. TaxID=2487765 RepID=A0A3G4ZWV2_9VIRU|nr:MAG: release factor h-coupled family protein [Edafosvirus sp.]